MTTARSHQLFCGQPAAGDRTLYTVPAGTVTLLKGWQVTNGNAAANTTFMSIVKAGVGILLPPFSLALASFGTLVSNNWTVMVAGDQLHVFSSLIGLQVVASGAELQA